MNITLIVISAIIIIFLLFLMTSINYVFNSLIQIEIEAPVDYVYKMTMDEQIMKEWFTSPQMDFEGMENISGFKNEVGSEWFLVFKSRKGTPMKMRQKITAIEENKKFEFDLSDPFFRFEVKMNFAGKEGKTIITELLRGKSKNHFLNGLMRIFGRKSRRVKAMQYKKLKEIIETKYAQQEEE